MQVIQAYTFRRTWQNCSNKAQLVGWWKKKEALYWSNQCILLEICCQRFFLVCLLSVDVPLCPGLLLLGEFMKMRCPHCNAKLHICAEMYFIIRLDFFYKSVRRARGGTLTNQRASITFHFVVYVMIRVPFLQSLISSSFCFFSQLFPIFHPFHQ